MPRQNKELMNLAIGNVTDLSSDDEAWTIPYLVVETGLRLSSRKVLVTRQHEAGSLDCDS